MRFKYEEYLRHEGLTHIRDIYDVFKKKYGVANKQLIKSSLTIKKRSISDKKVDRVEKSIQNQIPFNLKKSKFSRQTLIHLLKS